MLIQYDSPLEEIVDVHLRMLRYSKEASKGRILNTLWSAIVTAIWPVFMTHETMNVRLFFSFFGLFTGAATYWFLYPWLMRRKVRRIVSEAIGGLDKIDVKFEFTESCLQTQSKGVKIEFDWQYLTSIMEESCLIEFRFGTKGLAVIQKRAIHDNSQLQSILQFSKDHAPSGCKISLLPETV